MNQTKPIVCLVLIVKNEADNIAATLESVRDHVDVWYILDTGSTDGTQDIVRATMGSVPGFLAEAPFIDFSTSRNQALAGASTRYGHDRPAWLFMISADARVENAQQLRALADLAESQDAVAVRTPIHAWSLRYTQITMTRAGSGCAYGGVTHEALVVPEDGICLDGRALLGGSPIVHYRTEGDRTARWKLDVELLSRELGAFAAEQRQYHTRSIFYLAQSYECLQEQEKALGLYRERASYPGFTEERFIAALRAARCAKHIGLLEPDVVFLYEQAISLAPHRAEPYVDLAQYMHQLGKYPASYEAAREAALRTYPDADTLFVEPDVYDWRAKDWLAVSAFNNKFFDESMQLCRELLASGKLPEQHRPRIIEIMDRATFEVARASA